MPGDVVPQRLVGSVGAIQNFGGYFGGAFSPLVAGLIVDATGSYALARSTPVPDRVSRSFTAPDARSEQPYVLAGRRQPHVLPPGTSA